MPKKTYTGLNIQWPISELILNGKKIIETRTYPLPEKYLNEEMLLIETPGKHGRFKARIRAIIKFKSIIEYKNKKKFHEDYKRHKVEENSIWDWKDKPKWGWEVEIIKVLSKPIHLTKQKGIIYTKDITL